MSNLLNLFNRPKTGQCTDTYHQAIDNTEMDEDGLDSLSVKEDVNTVVPAHLSGDDVGEYIPSRPVRNFEQEQKQIQVILLLNYLVFFSEFSHMHFYYRFMTETYCRI
jgi:hypothetical protein